ncbi:MAG TPA: DUF3349 domain-containing protein [Trebonia sp.]|jgi:hypothetical protein|nr:DUF3349 domain-containing protein [Trebonia sp.]
MALASFLHSIIRWVRAGYPEGVPSRDYIPLFALLGSQLSEREVESIADELALTGDADSTEAIREAVTRATRDKPTESEVARVRARLAAGGWPLAPLDRDS